MLVALTDLSLTRYRGVNITYDYGKLFGVAVAVTALGGGVIVGTEEGTVGFFEGKKAKWKAKSTHAVLALIAHQTEADYLAIVARRNGMVEVKDWRGKGETVSKIKLHEELVGIFIHDFREDDNRQAVCVLRSGTLKGLNIHE